MGLCVLPTLCAEHVHTLLCCLRCHAVPCCDVLSEGPREGRVCLSEMGGYARGGFDPAVCRNTCCAHARTHVQTGVCCGVAVTNAVLSVLIGPACVRCCVAWLVACETPVLSWHVYTYTQRMCVYVCWHARKDTYSQALCACWGNWRTCNAEGSGVRLVRGGPVSPASSLHTNTHRHTHVQPPCLLLGCVSMVSGLSCLAAAGCIAPLYYNPSACPSPLRVTLLRPLIASHV
jgi:hypothetical protein